MTLVQKSAEGGEEFLAGFDFLPGELEAVMRGIGYQQSIPEGHVALNQQQSEVEISFRSKEAGRSHGCRIQAKAFTDLLTQFWDRPPRV